MGTGLDMASEGGELVLLPFCLACRAAKSKARFKVRLYTRLVSSLYCNLQAVGAANGFREGITDQQARLYG